jgi:phosphate transport system permease protein
MVAAGRVSKVPRNYRKYSSYELIEIVNNRSQNKLCKKLYSGSLMLAM